jgi:hypothetical protein
MTLIDRISKIIRKIWRIAKDGDRETSKSIYGIVLVHFHKQATGSCDRP